MPSLQLKPIATASRTSPRWTPFPTGGEWLYPARGLTVAVLPGTGLIAFVAAYRPASMDTYRRCFHDSSLMREFPSPRHENPA